MISIRSLVFAISLSLGGLAPLAAQESPVAAREIPRGVTLAAADVTGPDAERVVGWVSRRLIAEGEALRAPAISQPDIVRSGDQVQLVYRQGGMELRIVGKAMGSAAKDERVFVRVDQRGRYQGRAIGPGEVLLEEATR